MGAFVILIVMFFYLIPALEAHRRRHPQTEAIFMLNLLLGWTVLGWVAALIWALTKDTGEVRYG